MTPATQTIERVRAQPAAPGNRPTFRVWFTIVLLFLATVLNYLDRQTLAVAAPVIREEMGLSLEQMGLLFSAFFWAYAIFQVFAGILVDRVNVKWAYPVAVVGWSVAGAAAGLAGTFAMLFVLRALLAAFESANWPAALRVVTRTIPPHQRTLANGIFQSGTSIGALIAPPIMIWLITAYNWRAGFIAIGALGLVWVALWLWFFRRERSVGHDPEEVPPAADEPVAVDRSPSTIRQILRSPIFWSLAVASGFLNPVQYFYTSWLPTYYTESGEALGAALAAKLIIAYLLYDLGLYFSGALVIWLSRRLPVYRARLVSVAVGALCMLSIVSVLRLTDVNAVTAVISVATFGLGLFMPNYLAFASEVSLRRVSTVSGFLGAAGALTGAMFMWLVGWLADAGGFALPLVFVGILPVVSLIGIGNAVRLIARQHETPPPSPQPAGGL
jgi:ACS family hexuronate transporter-like MFS transporter